MYLEQDNPEDAIVILKELLSVNGEDTDEARYAALELADTYFKLAQHGDGNGEWADKSIEILDDFLKKYPDDPETAWVKRHRVLIDSIIVKRLQGCADYYHRIGRQDVAKKYLTEIIRDYSDTREAVKAEKMLAEISEDYQAPVGEIPRTQVPEYEYQRFTVPEEDSPVMIAPENSNGKWLLPVRDLRSDVKIDARRPVLPERTDSDDEI